jgi:hypothetical protein
MAKGNESLKLTVASLSSDISAEGLLAVIASALSALREINRELSPHGAENVDWRIDKLSMSSPAMLSFHGVDNGTSEIGAGDRSIDTLLSGCRSLDGGDEPPVGFNAKALQHVANLITWPVSKGIALVTIEGKRERIALNNRVAQNANSAIQRLALASAKRPGHYSDFGEIQGRLREVSEQSDRDKIVIIDELTGKKTPCFFRSQELEEKVRAGWKHRVVVTGELKVNRHSRDAEEMRVEDIRILRDRGDLPQINDLFGIDITGGMNVEDYVRGLRDVE